ncbi:hypothetical protein FYK55_10555 [Roseiconus nitratireducens]|uniref:Formylmethanofuran dehydrogenase subunit B n=1 Tax=Roseiconus nitratireducens TaxID=2605748 RepID=A0A5M6D7Y2_9BACT|nr:hypothetical protein [Roseiconus nitratireducens]KAA5543641.1 hypothetical protein FYK55_10555 [Roseiconus nitratireducens]
MSSHSIVCPFCPLACDDVTVNTAATDVGCELADAELAVALGAPPARLESDLLRAIDLPTLAGKLQLSPRPLVEANGLAIEECKQLHRLVQTYGLRLCRSATPTELALAQSVSRDGMIAATLAEICHRADLILTFGDLQRPWPRLGERVSAGSASRIDLGTASLSLLAELQTARLQTGTGAKQRISPPTEIASIMDRLRRSRYTGIVVGADAFDPGTEVIAAELLNRWIQQINERLPAEANSDDGDSQPKSRAALLWVSAEQNLQSVFRWRSNQDAASTWTATPTADIRIGSPRLASGHPVGRVQLQIGGIDPGVDHAHAYLPASQPGVHHRGTTIRGDGTVSLPLLKWSDSDLPPRLERLESVLRLTQPPHQPHSVG